MSCSAFSLVGPVPLTIETYDVCERGLIHADLLTLLHGNYIAVARVSHMGCLRSDHDFVIITSEAGVSVIIHHPNKMLVSMQ